MIEKSLEREIELVNLICDGLRLDPLSSNPAHLYNTGNCTFIEKAVSTWKEVISRLINVFDFDQNPEQITKFRELPLSEKARLCELINITCKNAFRLKSVISHFKQEYPDFVLEVSDYLNKLESIEKNLGLIVSI